MRKILLLFLCILITAAGRLYAQTRPVTGVVTGKDDGMPIVGASVLVKGTTTGTQTDVNGKFTLNAPVGSTLTISFLGYIAQDVPANGGTLNVVLVPTAAQLAEVVVTGYQTRTKMDNTSAIATVDPKEIADKPIPGIDNLLQGQAAGVQITTENGRPGANAFIRIRGTGSVNAGQQPLLVVDGVQIPDAMAPEVYNTLNANDVENLTILKDASGSALYGARGSNGVIVITTKSGANSESHVSYTFQYGTNRKIPDNFQMMNAAQKLQYEYDLNYQGNGDMLNYLAANNLPNDTHQLTPTQLQGAWTALEAQSHNWQNDILRSGKIIQHQVTLSGHDGHTNYYVSFQKYDEDGIVVGSDLNKYTGKINLSTDIKPWLTLTNNLNLAQRSTNETRDLYNAQNPFFAMYAYNPYEKVFNADGTYNLTSQGFPILEALKNNPELDKYISGYNVTSLDLHPIKNLHISSQIGLTLNDYQRQYYIKPGSVLDQYVGDPAAPGEKTDNGSRDFNYDWVNKIIYKFDVARDHHFNVLGVQEFQKDQFTSYSLSSKGFPDANLSTQNNAAANTGTNSTTQSIYTIVSFLGEFDYNYKGRYFATGSYRRDGSSRFGANNQYGNFGSGSIGWLITNEDFMKNVSWVNVLKLRASIGNTGNFSGINNYQAQGLYGFGKYNDASTTIPTQIANPNLTWEKKLKKDVGVDFELLKSRITGSFEYYDENTTGLLFQVPNSQTTGFSYIYENIGSMYNRGIDLSLTGDVIRTKDLKWSLYGNVNYNANKVTQLYNGSTEINSNGVGVVKPGYSIYTYKLVRYAGVNPQTGAAQFLDANGNITETYSASNAVVLPGKSPNPKYYGGFGTSVNYKGFELLANFTYAYGGYTYNNNMQILDSWGENVYQNQSTLALNYWKKPGDTNVLPKADQNSSDQNYTIDYYLQKDNYIRFKTLQLSYTIPASITQRFKVTSLRFFVTGENLLTINPDHFFGDPEVGIGSAEGNLFVPGQQTLFSYPNTRQFTFGANVVF